MDRETKYREIKRYAVDLAQLSQSYTASVSVLDKLDDVTVEGLYRIAVETDELHARIADEMSPPQNRD